MAHLQKPDFIFRQNGRVHLNRRWASVQSTTGSRGVRTSGSNAGYTIFRGSVKGTGYRLHSPVSHFAFPPVRHSVSSHFNWSLLTTLIFVMRYYLCMGFVGSFIRWVRRIAKRDCYLRLVCQSVFLFAWKKLASHWTGYHDIWYLSIFRKYVDEIQVSLISDNNNNNNNNEYLTWRSI